MKLTSPKIVRRDAIYGVSYKDMPEKFKNKYRIKTTRLENWNYGLNAGYFVTVCVRDRRCIFGDIHKEQMLLNAMGKVADSYWKEIPKYFNHVTMDEYIIMPDHLHGIIWVGDAIVGDAINGDVFVGDAINGVSTKKGGIVPIEKNPMLWPSLSTIIRWYKGRTTFEMNKLFFRKYQWQARFYEHIIRDEEDLIRIRKYIKENPGVSLLETP